MDKNVTKNGGELECHAVDARGPLARGQRRGLLAGRQDAGVKVRGSDDQAVGR
jgi:hypothetical protein